MKNILALLLISLSTSAYSVSGISETQWNSVIDRIEENMSPYFRLAGLDLTIRRGWYSDVNNAGAQADWDDHTQRYVDIHGGTGRAQWSTEDTVAALVCHEMGHHLGGYSPFDNWSQWGTSVYWPASEGAADYFASSKCLRAFFENQPNEEFLKSVKIPPVVEKKCRQQWTVPEDAAICIRSSLAGRELMKVWLNREISFDTPDLSIVTTGLQSYPSNQCRIDTFFQGALCTVDKSIMPSHSDHKVGVCNDTLGARPRCWYFSE